MCEVGSTSNIAMSAEERSNTQIPNIFEYRHNAAFDLLKLNNSQEPSTLVNKESDNFSLEREICSIPLDNIQEEQIVMENMVEYYIPARANYKFSKTFESSPKFEEISVIKSKILKPINDDPTVGLSNSSNKKAISDDSKSALGDSNTSKTSLQPVASQSLTHLEYSPLLGLETTISNEAAKKYSHSFLNSDRALEELNQQNMLAQELLKKYFDDNDNYKKKTEDKPKQIDAVIERKPDEKKLDTVSSLMKRYFQQRVDENEQVCIKPSDEYVFLNAKDTNKRNLMENNTSVKFVRPFKYHKKYWDSGSNLEFNINRNSPCLPTGPRRKRSRLEFESNVAVKQDSSTDTSLKTQNVQFLSTLKKTNRASDNESNQVLYKTDSKHFENTYSLEELNAFMPERYMSLRNLYGGKYVENVQEQQLNKPRFNFQTLPNKNNMSRELYMKFLDSGSHIKITDDDYKKWLKEKNFIKYTDFANSSVSSVTFRSISQKIVNYSLTARPKPVRERKRSRRNILNQTHQVGFNFTNSSFIPSLTNTLENFNFVDVEYTNLYQLVLYEHIVISNVINFYCSFSATRIKKLSMADRTYQVVFIFFCYYILALINSAFVQNDENWF